LGCIFGLGHQHEHGASHAVAEDAHPRPYIDRARQPVPARQHKNKSLANVVFSLVNGSLECSAIVAFSAGASAEFGGSQVNRFVVIQARGNH